MDHPATSSARAGCESAEEVPELLSFRAGLGAMATPSGWSPTRGTSTRSRTAPFIAQFGRLRPKTPEAMFRAQTLLVHEWRKFPFLDPDLPEHAAAGWPRSRAHDVFHHRHARWHAPAQDYFRSLEALGEAPRGHSPQRPRSGIPKSSRMASK